MPKSKTRVIENVNILGNQHDCEIPISGSFSNRSYAQSHIQFNKPSKPPPAFKTNAQTCREGNSMDGL